MSTYTQELENNRLLSSAPPDPCAEEFKLLKINGKYKYDSCYDYAAEVLPSIVADYKRWGIPDPEPAARLTLFEKLNPEISLHRRAYEYWTDMKWREFKKDWKPIEKDGLNYLFITFNFSDKVAVSDVVIETARLINLPLFDQTKLTYCYEYYGTSGQHPHVHMLVELKRTGTINPSKIEQYVFQKKSLREIMNYNYKLSWAKNSKDRCSKRAVHLAYISGMKTEEKQQNSELDKQWRRQNNLEDIYIKDK
jgi:hypothetical protein